MHVSIGIDMLTSQDIIKEIVRDDSCDNIHQYHSSMP